MEEGKMERASEYFRLALERTDDPARKDEILDIIKNAGTELFPQ